MNKNKALMYLIFIAISVKLIISPWATGDFQMPLGQTLNYVCDGILLFAVVLGVFGLQQRFLYLYLAALVSGLTYAFSTLLFTDLSSFAMLNTHLKIYLPLLAFPVLLKSYQLDSTAYLQAVKRLFWLIVFLLVLGVIILPNSMNRQEEWWPSYFSGLHSTAYVALMLMFLSYGLYKHGEFKSYLALSTVIVLSLVIYFGWGVRTATLASLVFIAGLISYNYRIAERSLMQYAVIGVPLLVIMTLVFVDININFDLLTSGRLSMYVDKYDQLMANNGIQWILGNGFGSDLIETDIWWWEAKGAHSDLITMLVEGGLIYLFLFFWVVTRLWREGGGQMKSMLLAVLVTTAVSNGVFVRPVAGYLLAIALVLFIEESGRNKVVS